MKTTVVSGMLGSGKTTFIGHLLRQSGERTVVLVNDFGALGIDGEVFSAAGIEAVDIRRLCLLHAQVRPDHDHRAHPRKL